MADETKFISVLTERFLPTYVRTEYTKFTKFITAYLEFLESTGNPYNVAQEFLKFIDIDLLDEVEDSTVIEEYVTQYIASFPLYKIENIDVKTLIKNAKDFYAIKGTEKSMHFLFRLMEESNLTFYYPQDDIFIISDTSSKISGSKKIHDNFYYAYFTYEVRGPETDFIEVKDILKNLMHPVGCKLFYWRYVWLSFTDTTQGTGKIVFMFFINLGSDDYLEQFNNVWNDTFAEMGNNSSYLHNITWGDLDGWSSLTLSAIKNTSNTSHFSLRKNISKNLVT